MLDVKLYQLGRPNNFNNTVMKMLNNVMMPINRPVRLSLKVMQAATLLLVSCAVFYSCTSEPPAYMTDPGQIIYLGYKDTFASCSRCHGEAGQGGSDAPEIRDAIKELTREELRSVILFGSEDDENEEMPRFEKDFTEQETTDLLDFLQHWDHVDSLLQVRKAAEDVKISQE